LSLSGNEWWLRELAERIERGEMDKELGL